jgi:ABC-2 type transport system permease protein
MRLLKYTAVLDITLSTQLAYVRDLVVRSIFMIVLMLIFAQLWTTTFGVAGSSGTLSGLSLAAVVWYVVITEAVTLSAPRISSTMEQEVRSGDLSISLLRPYNYLLYHLAAYWGEALARLPFNVLLGGWVAWLAVGPPPATPVGVIATAMAVTLGLTLNFAGETMIGLLAFWFEDTLPFYWIYQKLQLTIGGTMLPLEFFPTWLLSIARLLPFAATIYVPAHLFVAFEWDTFTRLLLIQIGWLVALGLGLRWLFARALQQVQVNGG